MNALLKKTRVLNMNALKFLAAGFMLVDHFGAIFFPESLFWRIIGRAAMPIFAFAISEGCRYTKNKKKHFFLLLTIALICQIVYFFFSNGSLHMSILVTFSLSVLTIYALQFFKKTLFDESFDGMYKGLAFTLLCATIMCDYMLCKVLLIEYGFWGIMLPVFASLVDFRGIPAPDILHTHDCLTVRIGLFSIGLVLLVLSIGSIESVALLAIPILLAYNGERGKMNTKYFFYLFYPLHLAILQGIAMIL